MQSLGHMSLPELQDLFPPLKSISCDGPVRLGRGSTRVRAPAGGRTGLDVDRIVLTSGPDGAASPTGPLVRTTRTPAVTVDNASPTEMTEPTSETSMARS